MKSMVALILAAGYSARMGSFKPLLPLGANSTVEKAVGCFLAAGVQDIRVVAGHRASEIIQAVSPLGAKIIENCRYDQGMYSSVLAGVSSFQPEVGAFWLLPGDIPLVKPQTIRELAKAYRESSAGIVYPCYQGARGHPPLISADHIEGILSWERPGGLRGFLGQFEDDALNLEVDDRGVVLDIDFPEDYQNILNDLGENSIPDESDCHVLLKKSGVPSRVIEHSRVVAEIAQQIAILLNRSGCNLQLGLVAAAGLLHDLAKGKPDHGSAGAGILKELGYPAVAEVVASHVDIHLDLNCPVNEKEVVYLADKLVDEDQVVELEDRYQGARERFANKSDVLEMVARRFENARLIKARIEQAVGRPLFRIIEG